MQYVNETVVEVNLPAVVSTKLHVKCTGHDSLKTHAHAILYTLLLSAWPLSQVKDKEKRAETWIRTVFSVSSKVRPSSCC